MKNTTTWKPVVCKCEIEIDNDTKEKTFVHTCDIHKDMENPVEDIMRLGRELEEVVEEEYGEV